MRPVNTNRHPVLFKYLWWLVVALLFMTDFAVAQQSGPVYVDVSECRNITVDLARVACYDTLADIEMAKKTGHEITQPATVRNDADRKLQEDYRIMREEIARQRNDSRYEQENRLDSFGRQQGMVVTDEGGAEVLYDRITALQKIPDGWIITLDSGQVWRQAYSKRYALREGHKVKIAPTLMGGSYKLSVDELGGFIQVKRIR